MAAGASILSSVVSGARVLVEIAWGADLTDVLGTSWVWSDVTADVRYNDGQSVVINPIGRLNETSSASPAGCTFQLRNPTGAYTAYNPFSLHWPNVRRNTPVRVRASVDGGATWVLRFLGYATGFNPSWDESANLSIVTVSAADITRRINQGKSPKRTPLARTIGSANPVVYHPLETSFTSAVSGGKSASATGTWTFSTDAPAGGAGSVTRGSLFATITVVTPTTAASGFRIDLCIKPSSTDTTNSQLAITDSLGNTIFFDISDGVTAGVWHHHRFEFYSSGGSKYDWYVDGVLGVSGGAAGIVIGGSTETIALGQGTSATNADSFSNFAVFSPSPTSLNVAGAAVAFVGETPDVRMARLCAEEGVAFATVDTYTARTTMGAQGVETFMFLMRDCETTDDGFLYGGLSTGFLYQGISQRYNQAAATTLDATRDVKYPYLPVDDDQRNINYETVSDRNNVSAVAADTTDALGTNAIGTYDSSVTVNPFDDGYLPNRASWDVHAGTIAGFRYPSLSMSMLTNPTLLGRWLARADASGPVLPGCRLDVTKVSTALPQQPPGTVSVVVEGYAEVISNVDWTVTGNCSQAQTYDVFKVGDSRLGRIDTDGSSMASGVSAGAASLSVATTAGYPLWTTTATNPSDFPFDVEIDGIQVTVTGISGTSSPQTFTVTASTVTKALATGKAVKIWHPGVLAL